MSLVDMLMGTLGQEGGLQKLMNNPLAAPFLRALPARLSAVLAQSPFGDLEGLLERLSEAGFGPEVESWLGPGDNLPLASTDIMEAIDPNTMEELARALSIPAPALPRLMALCLPMIVDRLSPDGTLIVPKA